MATENHNSKLDQKWHAMLTPLLVDELEYLRPKKELFDAQKQLFLNNEIENPTMSYPFLEDLDLDKRMSDLQTFKDELKAEENDLVKETYYRVVAEQIKKVKLLKATKERDDYAFSELSGELYGIPAFSTYNIVMKWFDWYRVRPSVFMKIMRPHFSSAEVEELFSRDLKRRKLDDWQARVDEGDGRTNMSVSHHERRINIPGDDYLHVRATPLTRRRLDGLRRHEVGVHVMRRINAEKGPLLLLTTGLDGYIKTEEGIAIREELKIGTGDKLSWNSRYLAVALCYGMDGPLRDFRATYEVLLKNISSVRDDTIDEAGDVDTNKNIALPTLANSDIAYQICYRIFRGTTAKTPGACYTKDRVYIGGLINAIETFKKYPEEEKRMLMGKYDVSNPFHREVMDYVGGVR